MPERRRSDTPGGAEAPPGPDAGEAAVPAGAPPELRLRRREERRIRAGHAWVFSNEVDTRETPLTAFEAGADVTVRSASGRFLGYGYVNPASLISARLLSRDPAVLPDAAWLAGRIELARALRSRWLGEERFCRLVHGEGDGLPGLVVDRYDGVLVGQISTAGMERRRADIEALLREVPGVETLYWANDLPVRELEGLPRETRLAFGEPPRSLRIVEDGTAFEVALQEGQKTGWYYDQRANRARLRRYVAGARLLDVFSYAGAWGVSAALAGAREVTCVDSSGAALEAARANAARNGVEIDTQAGDAAAVLKGLIRAGRRFEVIVLDPPALVPRRKDREAGRRAYRQLNELAVRLLADDALLVSCSCSHHVDGRELLDAVAGAARRQQRTVQLLERGEQSPDHPVHPDIPETRYLDALFCRITRPEATLER